MITTKGTNIGKPGGNSPMTMPGDTTVSRVGGQIPSTSALPTLSDMLPHLTAAASVNMPNTQDSASLPLFNATAGNTDTGVGHSGDLGGAGA